VFGTLTLVNRRPLAKALLFLGLSALAVIAYLFLLNVLNGKIDPFSALIPALFLALATLALNWRFFKADGSSLGAAGFDKPLLRLGQAAFGLVAGALTVAVWIAALRWIIPFSWRAAPAIHPWAVVASALFIVFNNLAEELVYRSYLFLLLMRSFGTIVAALFTSVLFTLLHIQAGVPWPNALATVLTSALLYAALFVRWRSVPLVLAFHVGMNVTQEVLGLRISGLTILLPQYGAQASAEQSSSVLVMAAAINLALVAAVWFSGRRVARESSSNQS